MVSLNLCSNMKYTVNWFDVPRLALRFAVQINNGPCYSWVADNGHYIGQIAWQTS